MQSTEEEIEEDLSEALRVGDTVYFMESLIEQCADRIQRHIKRRAQGVLDADEQAIVYSETLKQIFARISEPGFTVEKPLPFVFTVAKRRTIDATRKKTRLTIAENGDELLGEIVDRSKAGGIILKWRELSNPEKDEFNSIIAKTLVGGKLTRMQCLVVQAYVDHLLKFHDVQFKDLIQPLQDATGKRLKVATIRSHWNSAKEIIKNELIKNHFQFVEGA